MLKVGELKEIKVMLLDDDGNPTAGTISYVVYDENDASFAIGNMSTVAGVTGFYTMSFTPDAAGAWSVLVTCPDPNRTAVKSFDVGVGVEQDSYDAIVVLSAALVTHDTAIKALINALNDISAGNVWTHGTRTLTDPNSYKADVSALALEATLTAIKGGGWTTETLKVIKDAIDALDLSNLDQAISTTEANIRGVDSDTLKSLSDQIDGVSTLVQADILSDATPFAGGDIATILSNVGDNKTTLEHGTYGLSALQVLLVAIAGYLDTEIADIKTETDKIPRIVCKMDFTSLPLQVTLTSVAGDRGLVDVVVSGLPAGVTIIAVQGIFYCDSVENSFDGVNYLESTKIQVKEKTAGTDRDAITLEANKIFRFTAQMVRGGTVLTADWATATDAGILAEVVGNATYQMWFDVGETVQNNIVLDGAVFVLRIWFSV